jgi:hypothetical protein
MKRYDEDYVQELLAALPKGLTRGQFYDRCTLDIKGGYINEVQEAYWRYFKHKRRAA